MLVLFPVSRVPVLLLDESTEGSRGVGDAVGTFVGLIVGSFDRIGNSRWDTHPNMSYVRNTYVVEEKDIEFSDD